MEPLGEAKASEGDPNLERISFDCVRLCNKCSMFMLPSFWIGSLNRSVKRRSYALPSCSRREACLGRGRSCARLERAMASSKQTDVDDWNKTMEKKSICSTSPPPPSQKQNSNLADRTLPWWRMRRGTAHHQVFVPRRLMLPSPARVRKVEIVLPSGQCVVVGMSMMETSRRRNNFLLGGC